MLSYRHGFHAGNSADVLKHIVLIAALDHLARKPAPFTYIDTHAGAGLYPLEHVFMRKLAEYQNGVGRVMELDWPELHRYQELIGSANAGAKLTRYPGSPWLAAACLRNDDRGWLFELHPADFVELDRHLSSRKVTVRQSDGLQGLIGLIPPPSRRGLVLVDPSYEVKSEYDTVCETVARAWKRFSTGTYLIWYPVIERQRVRRMERRLAQSGLRNVLQIELSERPDAPGHGMTGSGLFVINPPWTLPAMLEGLLPRLAAVLADEDRGSWRNVVLVPE